MLLTKFTTVVVFSFVYLITSAQVKHLPDASKQGVRASDSSISQLANTANVADYSGVYTFSDFVEIWPFDHAQNSTVGNPIICDLNTEFSVEYATNDATPNADSNVIIKFLYFLKDSKASSRITNSVLFYRYNYSGTPAEFQAVANDPANIAARSFGAGQRYFLVKMKVFKKYAIRVPPTVFTKGALGFGILNYPFKFRIQPHINDFAGSFNVGAAVSYTYKHDSLKKWRYSHVVGIGISSITLDKAAVNTDTGAISSTNSLTALTLSYGFMVQYDKVQLGLFIGWDRISNLNNSTYGWKYQGNPWISLGIGYSIFSTNSSSTQGKTDTQSQ
jgi:hypothetical protein